MCIGPDAKLISTIVVEEGSAAHILLILQPCSAMRRTSTLSCADGDGNRD
jgi:hypothetical protein